MPGAEMLVIGAVGNEHDLWAPLLELAETRAWDLIAFSDLDDLLHRFSRDRPDVLLLDCQEVGEGSLLDTVCGLRCNPDFGSVPIIVGTEESMPRLDAGTIFLPMPLDPDLVCLLIDNRGWLSRAVGEPLLLRLPAERCRILPAEP